MRRLDAIRPYDEQAARGRCGGETINRRRRAAGFVIAAILNAAAQATYGGAPRRPAAFCPVVEVRSRFLLGGWSEGRWVPQKQAAPRLKGGERYRLFSLSRALGKGVGGRPTLVEPSIDSEQMAVRVTPEPPGEAPVFALTPGWNPLPRTPRAQSTSQKRYRDAVTAYLRGKGLTRPVTHLAQVIRIDLEGDGVEEVLAAASSIAGPPPVHGRSGDHSLVLLRKIVGGKVRTIPLTESIRVRVGEDEWYAPYRFAVAAILDLNGDGRMEVIVEWRYYEGYGLEVYEIQGGRSKCVLTADFGV